MSATPRQAPATVDPLTHMTRAPWNVSTVIKIDARFIPGSYLLKITDRRGGQTHVPLTVTDPRSVAPLALMSAPLTWQAYNVWGGYSTYYGPGKSSQLRARVVSFDRPYDRNHGTAAYFTDEYPLVRTLERAGLDVNYVTDVDVHAHPALLRRTRGVLLGSHSEYWSKQMRDGFDAARHAGVNLAFLSANISYWQVRLSASPLGANRTETTYKFSVDPVAATQPVLSTYLWRNPPVNRPESLLIGQQFESYGVKAPMVLSAPAWPFAAGPGTVLRDVVLGEYDRINVGPAPPGVNLQVLATSPVTALGIPRISTVTYYTAASGAGVFSAGTTGWVCNLTGACVINQAVSTATVRRVLTHTTLRLARAMPPARSGEATRVWRLHFRPRPPRSRDVRNRQPGLVNLRYARRQNGSGRWAT